MAITANPFDALEDGFSINVQRGEEAVVSPALDFFILRKRAQSERSAAHSAGRVRSVNPQAKWLHRMSSGRDPEGYGSVRYDAEIVVQLGRYRWKWDHGVIVGAWRRVEDKWVTLHSIARNGENVAKVFERLPDDRRLHRASSEYLGPLLTPCGRLVGAFSK